MTHHHPTRDLYDTLHEIREQLPATWQGPCWACHVAGDSAIQELAAKAAEHDRRDERRRAALAELRIDVDQADPFGDQVEAEPDDPNPYRVRLYTAAQDLPHPDPFGDQAAEQEQPHPLAGRWSRGGREREVGHVGEGEADVGPVSGRGPDVGHVAGASGDVEARGLREPDVGEVEPRGRDVGEVELGRLADGLCSTWTDTWRRHRYEPAGCSHHQAQVRELIARGRAETRSGFLRRLADDDKAIQAMGDAIRDSRQNQSGFGIFYTDTARRAMLELAAYLEENP